MSGLVIEKTNEKLIIKTRSDKNIPKVECFYKDVGQSQLIPLNASVAYTADEHGRVTSIDSGFLRKAIVCDVNETGLCADLGHYREGKRIFICLYSEVPDSKDIPLGATVYCVLALHGRVKHIYFDQTAPIVSVEVLNAKPQYNRYDVKMSMSIVESKTRVGDVFDADALCEGVTAYKSLAAITESNLYLAKIAQYCEKYVPAFLNGPNGGRIIFGVDAATKTAHGLALDSNEIYNIGVYLSGKIERFRYNPLDHCWIEFHKLLPAERSVSPSETKLVPAGRSVSPSETKLVPAGRSVSPSETKLVPAGRSVSPSETKLVPAGRTADRYVVVLNVMKRLINSLIYRNSKNQAWTFNEDGEFDLIDV